MATTFSVWYRLSSTGPDGPFTQFAGQISATQEVVSPLQPGTQYDFFVRATNESGSSDSPVITLTTLGELPGPATGLTLSNIATASVTLSWTAPTTGTTPIQMQAFYSLHTPTVSPASGFTVTNNTIYDPNGNRFVSHGITAFNRAFETNTTFYRQNWAYRSPTVPGDGISPPTGFLPSVYTDHNTCFARLQAMSRLGVNLVRIFVEPAVFNTAPYTDPTTGLSFPAEPDILDDLVASAAQFNIVVQFQPGNDNVPDDLLATFMGQLASRYASQWNVWLQTSNEPFSQGVINPDGSVTFPNPNQNNATAWAARIGGALTAIRTAGFTNPVVVGPLELWKIQDVIAELSMSPFTGDPALVLGPHMFYVHHDDIVTFQTDVTNQFQTGIAPYTTQYALIIDEFGYNNSPVAQQPSTVAFLFSSWVPDAFNWLNSPNYDGITFFVWPPAFNEVEDLSVENSPADYELTTWGQLAFGQGFELVGAASWTAVGLPGLATTANITGLTNNTEYDFKVTSSNSIGSRDSDIISGTTVTGVAPGAPGTPTASNITSTSFTVTTTGSTTGTTPINYQFQYRPTGSGSYTKVGSPSTALSFTITGLTAATGYDVQVVASNGFTPNHGSPILVDVVTAGASPSQPTNPVVTDFTNTTVSVDCTASATGTPPIDYQWQYRVHGTSGWTNGPAATTSTAATVTGLAQNTGYDFQVIASNGSGSATSPTFATTTTTVVIPSTPTGLADSNVTPNGATWTWSASSPSSPPVSYQLQYRQTGAAGPLFNEAWGSFDVTDNGYATTANQSLAIQLLPGEPETFTDSKGAVWTLNGSAQPVRNGTVVSTPTTPIYLFWFPATNIVWYQDAPFNWYYWSDTGSVFVTGGGVQPLATSTNTWMNHYPFGGAEFLLPSNSEAGFFCSPTRCNHGDPSTGYQPLTIQSDLSGVGGGTVAGPALRIQANTVANTAPNPGIPGYNIAINWNSGAVTTATETNGLPTPGIFMFTYGYVEGMLLMPKGEGLWPTLWMEPVSGEGGSEIDICECTGDITTQVYQTLVTSPIDTVPNRTVVVSDYSQNWHTYGVDWQADFITFYVDGARTIQQPHPTPANFHTPHFILLNLAIIGNTAWTSGPPNSSTHFPANMYCKYVRVWPNFAASQATGTSGTYVNVGPTTLALTETITSGQGPLAGTQYDFRIFASNSGGSSAPSSAVTITTATEAAQGTTITTSGLNIFISQTPGQAMPAAGPFNEWALTGTNGSVIRNGVTDTTTSSVTLLLQWNHTAYYESSLQNSLGVQPGWWSWNGQTWHPEFGDPRGSGGTESPDPTTITTTGQTIFASTVPGQPPSGGALDTWTLPTGAGGAIARNGTNVATTTGAIMGYYTKHTLYFDGTFGSASATPAWSDEFTSWTTPYQWASPSLWEYNCNHLPTAASFTTGGPNNVGIPSITSPTWWANPLNANTTTSQLIYAQGGQLVMALMKIPSGMQAWINNLANSEGFGNQVYLGNLVNNFRTAGRQYGYYEFVIQVDKLPGMMWELTLEDFGTGLYNNWSMEFDVDIWTDESGTQQLLFAYWLYPDRITAYQDSSRDYSQSHKIGLDWQAATTTFYIDDVQVFQMATPALYTTRKLANYMETTSQYGQMSAAADVNALPVYARMDYLRIYATKPAAQATTGWWYWNGSTFIATTDPRPGTPTISLANIGGETVGQSFQVTATLGGYAAAPSLLTGDNGATPGALPSGAVVTNTKATFTHAAINTATNSYKILLEDSNNTNIFSTTTFSVSASGTGPVVSGNFVNVDFGNLTGASIDRRLFGGSTAGMLDFGCLVCATLAFQVASKALNMPLLRFNGGDGYSPDGSTYMFQWAWRNYPTADFSAYDNLTNNLNKIVDLDTCQIMFGMGAGDLQGLDGGAIYSTGQAAAYADMCKRTVQYFRTVTGSDGKVLDRANNRWGYEILNEPPGINNQLTSGQYNALYIAAANAILNAFPDALVSGPVRPFISDWSTSMYANVPAKLVQVTNSHEYLYCPGQTPTPSNLQVNQGLTATTNGNGESVNDLVNDVNGTIAKGYGANLPFLLGEYNVGCGPSDPAGRDININGALFAYSYTLGMAARTGVQCWGGIWEYGPTGGYGQLQPANGNEYQDSAYVVMPPTLFLSRAAAKMPGQFVSASATGLMQAFATKNGSSFGVALNNPTTSTLAGQVALSRWPVNSSGNGTLDVWTISSANGAGAVTSVNVTGGLTGTVTMPPTSVVILSTR